MSHDDYRNVTQPNIKTTSLRHFHGNQEGSGWISHRKLCEDGKLDEKLTTDTLSIILSVSLLSSEQNSENL